MKKKKSLFIVCLALALLCTVHCTDEDLFAPSIQTTLQGFSLEEAQTFFREQAEKYATLGYSLDDESRQTLSPGDFVPEWEEAMASVQGGLACYNVPIVSTYHFKAVSVEERGTAMQASKVNVYQKLVIVKELSTGRMSQYILTLIPTPSYDARNGSSTAVNFVNCGEKQGYSGLAVYACVYTPFTARVSRYEDGKRVQGVFLLAPETRSGQPDTAVDLARTLTASVMVRRGKIATTRFEDDYGWDWDIDGGELPEVVVTPDYDWDQWLDETRPDGNVDPEPEENYPEDSAEDEWISNNDKKNENDQNEEEITHLSALEEKQVKELLGKLEAEKNINPDKYIIMKIEGRPNVAITNENGTLLLGNEFFSEKLQDIDRMAILWHEMYHIDHKQYGVYTFQEFSSPIILNPPPEVANAIRSNIMDAYEGTYAYLPDIDAYYQAAITITGYNDPTDFYANEVETHQAERENFPDVSDYYENQRIELEWRYQETQNILKEQGIY